LSKKIRFIDLFAGIGGFHLALDSLGAKCVFVSEWDEPARKTYRHNFANRNRDIFGSEKSEARSFVGDIRTVSESETIDQDIPDFDLLCGGFPCQPFSQAGLKKGMDETRGTLFFDILKILEAKKPKAFFLENVRGLLKHKSEAGVETMDVIRQQLTAAGYHFSEHLVRASDFGVPQHRPRLFIIGFREQVAFEKFQAPKPIPLAITLNHIMGGETGREVGYTLRVGGRGSGLSDRRNWDTYLVDGAPKRLTSKEGLRLQGFPEWFEFPDEVSETQAMKQLGNSVAVPAVKAFAQAITKALH
jgi:DNA (cytosine-5)-methyltransferase 1